MPYNLVSVQAGTILATLESVEQATRPTLLLQLSTCCLLVAAIPRLARSCQAYGSPADNNNINNTNNNSNSNNNTHADSKIH